MQFEIDKSGDNQLAIKQLLKKLLRYQRKICCIVDKASYTELQINY